MADTYNDNDIEIQEPEVGIEPGRPRIRKLNQAEIEQWSKGIHKVCESPSKTASGTKRGWVPQLRAAYSHLMPFVDEQCPTAYTDCRYRIGINPDFLDPEKTSVEKLAFIILHETMHNTQHHRDRLLEKKGLNGKLANFATDLEINGIIAQGVFGIDLSRPESPANGNWDYLMGEFRQLNDEQADNINKQVDENGNPLLGRTYKGRDWFYQGGLIPKHGQFSNFPTDWTAEQYLALLEVETEDMTLREFQDRQQQDKGQEGGDSGSSSDGMSGSSGSNGGMTSGGAGEGNGSADGNAGTNSGNGNTGSGAPSDGTSSSGGNGMGDLGDDGNVHLPGEQPSGNGGQGRSGSENNDGDALDDGYGGQAEKTDDGHVKVTHIYKKNADGTRTEVGKDALVDDIGKSMEDEVWKEASKLGINPITRGEAQKVKEQIAHDIEVFRRTNSYGYGHSDVLLNYIERGLRPPMVDWKKALRHAVTRACQEQTRGRDDYTYRRINRRYSQGDFIFPGMTSYVPTIRFALDTSGSMSADEYYNALSEADSILKLTKAKIQFVCWDGAAGEVQKVKTIKDIRNMLTGGGGTAAEVVCQAIAEEKPKDRPDVVVIATDGCFAWEPFAESLALPEMRHIVPIVLIVYPFTEDRYYAKQGELREHQDLLRKYHKKAQVLQAWAKR